MPSPAVPACVELRSTVPPGRSRLLGAALNGTPSRARHVGAAHDLTPRRAALPAVDHDASAVARPSD